MIDKEKLIAKLESTINNFYIKSNMTPDELFKFRDKLAEIIENLKKGHYDAICYYDVDEYYEDDEDVWCK